MTWFEYMEAASYLVTIIGLPWRSLSSSMNSGGNGKTSRRRFTSGFQMSTPTFLKLVLGNPDLQLLRKEAPTRR